MLESSYPQTDTRQTERQRERHGNVVDWAEQEFQRDRETLRQMQLAASLTTTEHQDARDGLPTDGLGSNRPGEQGWDDWDTWPSEH